MLFTYFDKYSRLLITIYIFCVLVRTNFWIVWQGSLFCYFSNNIHSNHEKISGANLGVGAALGANAGANAGAGSGRGLRARAPGADFGRGFWARVPGVGSGARCYLIIIIYFPKVYFTPNKNQLQYLSNLFPSTFNV